MHYIADESPALRKPDCSFELSESQHSVASVYPFKVSRYYAGLIKSPGDAIWRQCIPDVEELEDDTQMADPLAETILSPVPGLIHRYPDRVVLLVSNRCPVYCRFCMRKRHVGTTGEVPLDPESLDRAVSYIRATPAIRDVILSGGDPLMLDDTSLHTVLSRLRDIRHVKIIRIGTRIPVTMPERVTPELCRMLSQFHPLYVNTHFNHPDEITDKSSQACELLANAGIGLLELRVKPYYIHQMDLIKGTAHFRTPVSQGLEIIRALRGHTSGMAVPHYVIDLPEGKGKVALLPEPMEREGDILYLRTYQGERIAYREITIPQA
jgi:lysine 2,3-aminomutase